MPLAVEARSISVSAGFRTLISGVTFRAEPGEVLAILGPSGAGKSTLFRALNGTREPDGGKVVYGEDDLYDSYEKFRMHIGYVPQDDILHDSLDPSDVLYFSGRLRMPAADEETVRKRVGEVLSMVDLSERAHVRVSRLSGGQRKRVNLGVELMTSPDVLFLDEPTSGLDPALEEKMMELFSTLARGGRTVFVTTHVTESLDRVDRVLILCAGKLTFLGRPDSALKFFGVDTFSDIYGKLTGKGADHWVGLFGQRGPDLGRARVAATAAGHKSEFTAQAPVAGVRREGKTAEEILAELERQVDEERRSK